MTLEELRQALDEIGEDKEHRDDKERDHEEADELLLEYIGDAEVRRLYGEIDKWYS